jgi:hypothetical protein
MMDVFSVEIVSAVSCTSMFLRRDQFFEAQAATPSGGGGSMAGIARPIGTQGPENACPCQNREAHVKGD